MALNPNPEKPILMKKACSKCGRKIVKVRVDWKDRHDFVCQTCKTIKKEESQKELQRKERNIQP